MGLARQLGAFRTSMLQDAQAGRPLELDALAPCAELEVLNVARNRVQALPARARWPPRAA